MGFFLETLIGGLMAGMLYSLVALGFVLIFKASGVFNFAQGAMVLFAALAMARFAEWIPQWTGINSLLLANLLANAGIHTPAGVTVTTSVAALPAEPVVELTVSDDGPGIPEAIMGNLFGRFVRADKARSRELGCSGLGLAIVASIVEAHNGTVSARSRPGRTTFVVRLPAASGDAAPPLNTI